MFFKRKNDLFYTVFTVIGITLLCFVSCTKKEGLKDIRLFDYKPKSMLVVKETKVKKAKFPVIDAHNHLNRIVNSETDAAEYVKIMDECNVKMVIDLDGGWGENLDKHLKKLKKRYPDRFIVLAQIDFSRINEPDFTEQAVKQLEESIKKGAQGLKIFKSLGLGVKDAGGKYIRVDDARLDPIWETCGKYGIPVTIHTSDPLAFFTPLDRFNERLEEVIDHPDWMFNKPEYYSVTELMEQRNNVIEKHKNTNFIGVHIGSMAENLKLAAEYLDKYPNLYYDTAARIHELGRQPYSTRKFLIKYSDRILFGSDGCDTSPIDANMYHLNWRFYETDDDYFDVSAAHHYQGRWMVYGVYLPDDVLENIYYLNAKKLYKLK